MLALTVGQDLDPIESVLRKYQPSKVLLFHLPNHPTLTQMKTRLRTEFGVTQLETESLPYPTDDGARGERLRSMYHALKAFEDTADKSDTVRVCVSGGTKWMSHALHQVAFSLGFDLILTSHPKFERAEEIITLPSTHRAIQLAKRLDAMRSGQWTQLVLVLYESSPRSMTREELSDILGVSRQSIEHMFNGRQSGSGLSAQGLHGVKIVEQEIINSSGRGAPQKNLRLTELGEEVARIIQA